MTAAPAVSIRTEYKVRGGTAASSALVATAHGTFERYGVAVTPGRVRTLVNRYLRQVQRNGFPFADFMANQVAMSEMQRRVVCDELRKVVPYADPTGETAVRNVMRERGR